MGFIQQIQQLLRSLFQWWVIIAPWQQGVRVRFGKHVRLLNSGVHLKLPLVDDVYVQPIRIRSQYIQGQTITTKDGKIVCVAAAVRFQIDDLVKLYDNLHNAHDTIEQEAKGAIFEVLSGKEYSDIDVDKLSDDIVAKLDFTDYGLCIKGFSITDFALTRTYRLINESIGHFTGYDQRLETVSKVNDNKAQ